MQSEYTIDSLTQERDYYKAHLDAVLAAAHRDGGQYTILAGYQASVADAVVTITATHLENVRLRAHLGKRQK